MGFSGKVFPKGTNPPAIVATKGPHAFNKYFYIRIGIITDVDYQRYTMTVTYLDKDGARPGRPISFPLIGPAGCIGMLPEEGSIGLFGFINEDSGKGAPVLLSYLPSGLYNAINQNVIKKDPDFAASGDINELQHRFRKLDKGDLICASSLGSGLFLNKDVELYDSIGDILRLREDDQAIIQTSLNNYIFADGASLCIGPAVRNGLVLYNKDGKIPKMMASSMTMSNGQEMKYIVPFGQEIGFDTQYYTEYRVDVDDFGDGRLDLNDINANTTASMRDPVVTLSLGNFIGANSRDPRSYGKILRALSFRSPTDRQNAFSLVPVDQANGLDGPTVLGMAYALNFPKSGSLLGVDKEGHYYINLSKTKANPLGAGRSMSITAQGNLKEVWGADSNDANSWDLTASGGVRWFIGQHTNGVSFDFRTSSSVYMSVGGKDKDGFAKQEIFSGNVKESVGGKKTIVTQDLELTISGMKKESIVGASSASIQGDNTINVMGVFTESVIKEKQSKIGKRKTTITTGNDELTLIKGNILETIQTFGKKSTTITAGSIEQTLITGKHKTSITSGAYNVEVSAGSAGIKALAGATSMQSLTMTLKGSANVYMDTPIARLGSGASIGGAISGMPGKPSHFDYVTGAPHKGSMKVGLA
jgi:hypothetical protein